MARHERLDVNTLHLTGTEIEYLDGITIGTGAASKAVVLDANGTCLFPAPLRYDINTTITAYATGGQANAVALTGEYNNVTTCATDGDSVKLPAALGGEVITVKNSGAASLAVFPATDDSINAMAVNLSVNIAPGGTLKFFAISATVWETQEVLVLPAPSTQKGELIVKATDNTGDTVTTVTNAAMGQASVVTIPDPGAATADFVLDEADSTIGGNKTFSAGIQTSVQVGSVGSGVTATEYGDGFIHNTRLALAVTDAFTTGDNAALGDGHLIYTFPAGQIVVHSASLVDIAITSASTEQQNDTPDVGLGTTEATGVIATLDGTPAMENILTGQTWSTGKMNGTAQSAVDMADVATGNGGLVIADGGDHTVYLNIADTWADDLGGDLTADVTGVVHLVWSYMGNPA
jgi:hypothetical protein